MKKTILIIIFLISIPYYSYATWSCLIKDKSAQVLLDYIKNNRKVVSNISKSITKNRNKETSKINKNAILKSLTKSEGLFNEAFNFPSYYSYSKYFATFPIFNEIPYSAKRDYKLLNNEGNWLMSYWKTINNKWVGNIIVQNPCAWVTWFCDYEEWTVNDILWNLIINNELILDLYRSTIMWEENDIKFENIQLVNNNFILEIKKHYSKEAISECNSEKWWFFEQITTSIEQIWELNQEWEDWIQRWKDAWQLLVWNNPGNETEIEKEVLKDYLNEEWIFMNNQEVLLNNLEKYNLEWLSLNNNFITNTFSLIKSNINKELKRFKEEIIDDSVKIQDRDNISIEEIKKLENNSFITRQIQEEITILYENELPFTAIWDINTENLRAKIIEAHASLERSIRTLDKTIPRSQNVCNSQGWWWNCN